MFVVSGSAGGAGGGGAAGFAPNPGFTENNIGSSSSSLSDRISLVVAGITGDGTDGGGIAGGGTAGGDLDGGIAGGGTAGGGTAGGCTAGGGGDTETAGWTDAGAGEASSSCSSSTHFGMTTTLWRRPLAGVAGDLTEEMGFTTAAGAGDKLPNAGEDLADNTGTIEASGSKLILGFNCGSDVLSVG